MFDIDTSTCETLIAPLGKLNRYAGPPWAYLGPMLSPSWAYVGPSWGYVDPSWGYVGPMLELC